MLVFRLGNRVVAISRDTRGGVADVPKVLLRGPQGPKEPWERGTRGTHFRYL